jgi:hypothetical protein
MPRGIILREFLRSKYNPNFSGDFTCYYVVSLEVVENIGIDEFMIEQVIH